MSADQLLIALMAAFALLGTADRILGGRFGAEKSHLSSS